MRAAPTDSPAWRAAFAATLLWAMAAGTLIPFAVGALAPFVSADLDLSRAQVGALSTVFFAVGAVCSPLAGPLVDRLGGRRMLLGLLVVASAALAGMGLAPGYALLLVAAAAGGVATAAVNPVTNQLIAVALARGAQGLIMGVKQSGVQVGAFLAGGALPTAALTVGWRAALAISGAVAALGVVAAVAVLPRSRELGEAAANGTAASAGEPRPSRFVGWLAAYALLMGAGGVAVISFLVLYAVEELGWSESVAGAAAATVALAGVLARMMWGRIAERLRTSTAPLLALAVGATAAQALIWAAQAAPPLLWVGAAVFGVTAGAWNAVAMLAIVREVPSGQTGWASGVVQAAFYVGLMVCPPAFGWSVDATGAYNAGWAGVTALLAAAAAVTAVWHRRDRARRAVIAG